MDCMKITLRLFIFLFVLVFTGCNGFQSRNSHDKTGETVGQTAQQLIETNNSDENNTLIECINKSALDLTAGLARGTVLAVLGISTRDGVLDEALTEFAEEQLIYVLVLNGNFRVVERKDLDLIRREQNFQLSGDVDDATAVSIGKMAGASIVITGSILPYGEVQYLNLRALDVESAQIRAASSRPFSSLL